MVSKTILVGYLDRLAEDYGHFIRVQDLVQGLGFRVSTLLVLGLRVYERHPSTVPLTLQSRLYRTSAKTVTEVQVINWAF